MSEKERKPLNPDVLSADAIRKHLRDPCTADGIHIFQTIGSTNDEGKIRARRNAPDRTVILAEQQTRGKGRMGRGFFSPAVSGIYMSVLLRPERKLDSPGLYTAAAAVAVARAIEQVTGIEVKIKWVNDIMLGGRKVCGILAETVRPAGGGEYDALVIGIGLNFTPPECGFPPELCGVAGALFDKKPGGLSRNELAAAIINHVTDIAGTPQNFLTEYKNRSMLLGEKIRISGMGKTIEATAEDISENGHLIVRDARGERLTLCSGEISVRRTDD